MPNQDFFSGFAFRKATANTLMQMANQFGSMKPLAANSIPEPQTISSNISYIIKTPSGGIGARDGTTPGSADCNLYYIDTSGPTLTEWTDDDGDTVSKIVYNLDEAPIAGDIYLLPSQELLGGQFVISQPIVIAIGKLDAILNVGSSATMSVWSPNTSGTFSDTTKNLTVYDWFLGTGESIASGKKVAAIKLSVWVVIAAECP